MESINKQKCYAQKVQQEDKSKGYGPSLPFALGKKYPNAFRRFSWMFLFPSTSINPRPLTGEICRHHLHDSVPRKALKKAVTKTGINEKRVSCHTFRHVQEWLGHNDVSTNHIYTHLISQYFAGTNSPFDQIL